MIDHVTIGVSDLEKSKRFYERAFAPLGYKISFGKAGVFFAFDIGEGLFEIQSSGKLVASVHVAFRVKSRADADAFYTAAIEAGGTDNGVPGPRPQYTENYYACFVLDPDGHNIEVMID